MLPAPIVTPPPSPAHNILVASQISLEVESNFGLKKTVVIEEFIFPSKTPKPSNPTHLDAPIVESNVDSDIESDVDLISFPDRNP